MNDKLVKQLTELAHLPTPFAKNLNDKGVVASSKETLNALIDKIPLIPIVEGDLTLGTKEITQDGDYFPINDGVDAYSSVSVNIMGDNDAKVKFLNEILGVNQLKRVEINGNIPKYCYNTRSDIREVHLNGCEEIGQNGFNACKNMTLITNNTTIKKLETYALANCSKVEGEIILDDNMTMVPDYAFYNDRLLTINLPKNVEVIEQYAYMSCENLFCDNLPKTLRSVGAYGLANCKNLTAKLMPVITNMGNYAFKSTGVQFEEIPYGVILSSYAFYDCQDIIRLKFNNEGIISNYCFQACYNLELIDIGTEITRISTNSFRNCTKLKTIICRNTNPPELVFNAINSCPIETIYVPASALETYKSATNWSAYADKMIEIEGE